MTRHQDLARQQSFHTRIFDHAHLRGHNTTTAGKPLADFRAFVERGCLRAQSGHTADMRATNTEPLRRIRPRDLGAKFCMTKPRQRFEVAGNACTLYGAQQLFNCEIEHIPPFIKRACFRQPRAHGKENAPHAPE